MTVEKSDYQVAVIGAGPAGLFAAFVAARRKKKVILIGKEKHSTRLVEAEKIENYPGIGSISGREISENLWRQLENEDVAFLPEEVQIIGSSQNLYQLYTRNNTINVPAVILATGVKLRGALPGEKEMAGRGVSYCANCDAMFFSGKTVAVVAYSHEGEEEANYLADVCSRVFYLPQYRKKTGFLKPNVTLAEEKVLGIEGEEKVQGLSTQNGRLDVDGVFIIRESLPPDELLPGLALEGGFIKVNRDLSTNLPGVFAAGDCTGKPWQIAKSIGEGQVAALSAAKYLDDLDKGE